MKRLQFTVRDFFWICVVAAVLLLMQLQRAGHQDELNAMRNAMQTLGREKAMVEAQLLSLELSLRKRPSSQTPAATP